MKILPAHFLLGILISGSCLLSPQATSASARERDTTTFRPNNYSFELSNSYYPRPNAITLSGKHTLTLRRSVSVQLGFMYSRYWKSGVGFRVGVRFCYIPIIAHFHVPQSDLPQQFQSYGDQSGHVRSYYIQFFQFPIEASYRIPLKKKFQLTFSTGIAIELGGSGMSHFEKTYPGLTPYEAPPYFVLYMYQNPGNKVFFNVPFEVMASKTFKNMGSFDFGLCAGLMLQDQISAVYVFLPDQANSSKGIFYMRNSYFAIKLGYTIRGRDKIRKVKKL